MIAGRIPGRTDNEIKNYWNTHLSKKLISQGIDPRTHKPFDSHHTKPKPTDSTPQLVIPNPNPNYVNVPTIDVGYFTAFGLEDDVGFFGNESEHDHVRVRREEEEDDCGATDEVFSSFLNSLINENEDAFPMHQPQINNGGDVSSSSLDWESPPSDHHINVFNDDNAAA